MQRSVITAMCLTAALLAWQPMAASAQTIQVRYGQIESSVRSMSSLALHAAQRKGFFTREGLDVKVMPLPGVHHMIDALDKDLVDISQTATPYLVQGVLKGSDAVGVIGAPANSIFSLIAKPDIADYAALQGKMVGMSLPQDTISIASRMLLAKHGLKEPAFRTKELIGTPIRATCLSSGECDAVPLGQPDDIVFVQRGFRKLGDSLEVMPVLQFSVIAARRAWAAQNRDTVLRLARAFGAAYKFAADPANRNETAGFISELTGATNDVARQMLVFYYEPLRGVLPRQAEINMDGMAKVIELLGQSGELSAPLPDASRFVDLQYLQAAGLQ